jgi:hypothetical protein
MTMETVRTMKRKLTTEDVYYKLNWYLTPITKAPTGGPSTNLGNQYLPPGAWFKTRLRQSDEPLWVFYPDREWLKKKASKSVLLKDLVVEYANGDRQNLAPHSVLHLIIYG